MAHNKLLVAVLPLVGLASIAGTGFAAWYFTQTEDTKVLNGSIEVTDEYHGTLTINDLATPAGQSTAYSFNLSLDQGKNGGSIYDGISFDNGQPTKTRLDSLSAKFNAGDQTKVTAFTSGKLKLTLKATFNFLPVLLKYVDVDSTAIFYDSTQQTEITPTEVTEGTTTYKSYVATKEYTTLTANQEITFGAKTEDQSTDNTKKCLLKYKEPNTADGAANPGKPTSSTALSAMKTALTGQSVSNLINIKFEVLVSNQ